MPVSPIGNLTYINQASAATSSIHAGNMSHPVPVNTSVFQEQMQKINETRPTENTHKVNEDRDGNTEEFAQNHNKRKKTYKEEEEITEATMLMKPEIRILDIKG